MPLYYGPLPAWNSLQLSECETRAIYLEAGKTDTWTDTQTSTPHPMGTKTTRHKNKWTHTRLVKKLHKWVGKFYNCNCFGVRCPKSAFGSLLRLLHGSRCPEMDSYTSQQCIAMFRTWTIQLYNVISWSIWNSGHIEFSEYWVSYHCIFERRYPSLEPFHSQPYTQGFKFMDNIKHRDCSTWSLTCQHMCATSQTAMYTWFRHYGKSIFRHIISTVICHDCCCYRRYHPGMWEMW